MKVRLLKYNPAVEMLANSTIEPNSAKVTLIYITNPENIQSDWRQRSTKLNDEQKALITHEITISSRVGKKSS
jgi:hypothetical protein